MTLLAKKGFSFPTGSMPVFDTSAILSNVEVFKNLFGIKLDYLPVLTSGVYNELRGMRDDPDKVRGELAREIFPIIHEAHRKYFWYIKSEILPPTIPGLSGVDENLIQVCKRLPRAILVSNDQWLLEAAQHRGIPTRSVCTNIS